MQGLRKVNILAGFLHLIQMTAVLALCSDFALLITATYMAGPQDHLLLLQSFYLKLRSG